mmetsp:Transcript_5733/g.9023  ORF Transcript_5733/g.9023 Transcript_5733/m.9023 type:complete len:180 (+) Transcript_5733:782-1321(+)
MNCIMPRMPTEGGGCIPYYITRMATSWGKWPKLWMRECCSRMRTRAIMAVLPTKLVLPTTRAPPNLYETGALYQGYGTHYLDLWVGSPTPQRQTVIIVTSNSSITTFPCIGCQNCGSNPAMGQQYHLDDDFDVELSGTYEEKQCARGVSGERNVECDLGTFTRDVAAQQKQQQHCQLAS